MTRQRVEEEAFQAMLEGRAAPSGTEDRRIASLVKAIEAGRPSSAPAHDFQAVLRRKIVMEAERAARLPWRERASAWLVERNETWRRSFRVVTATGLAAMLMIVSGAVLALAAHSKPGDWDYGIKRGQEAARLAVTRGALPRGYLQLEFARTRLSEVKALSSAHITETLLYVDTLNDMDSSTLNASELLIKASRAGAGIAPLAALEKFSIAQRLRLESVVEQLPPGARPAARDSLTVLVRLTDRVVSIEAGCTCPANPLEVPAGAVNPPSGSVSHGGNSLPCSCNTTHQTVISGDGTVDPGTPGGPKPKPKPQPKPAPGVDLLPGTSDKPVNDALDNLLQTLHLKPPTVLQTPLPVPVPTPSVSLPALPVQP